MRPLLLDPVLVPKPWGGRRLADLGADLPADGTWGESWVVADLDPADTPQPDPASRVRRGEHAGRSLADVIAADRDGLLGTAADVGGRFPLLVKVLDAREHLSVQAHPPASLLSTHPTARLKTESWVVVAADDGAELFLGLDDGVTRDRVRAALGTPDLVPLLHGIPARVGDVFHVPAGMVHALGAGVVVAEVQTPSDTTWRLYDWTDEYGREPRDLHIGPGWDAIDATWAVNTTVPEPAPSAGRLVTTEAYTIDRVAPGPGRPVPHPDGRPAVVLVLAGALDVGGQNVGPGQVVVVPADLDGEPPSASADTEVLVVVPTDRTAPDDGLAS